MSAPEQNPTPDQLLAMAYADGELDSVQRADFESRLTASPALAREVSDIQALNLLARSAAPPEPADHEWARLDLDPMQRSGLQAGSVLCLVGVLGLAAFLVYGVCSADDLSTPLKSCVLALVGGVTLLLLMTIRERLNLLPYDPYRKVQR